jgi:hypothetical protein
VHTAVSAARFLHGKLACTPRAGGATAPNPVVLAVAPAQAVLVLVLAPQGQLLDPVGLLVLYYFSQNSYLFDNTLL